MTKLTKVEQIALEELFEEIGIGAYTITVLINLIERIIK